jgi:hypothetical protein
MFLAQSLNKLLICGLVTVLSQDAQKSLKYEKKSQFSKNVFWGLSLVFGFEFIQE